jgi:metal-responsive CopG/Arc/MetJ family transcriptional regulator
MPAPMAFQELLQRERPRCDGPRLSVPIESELLSRLDQLAQAAGVSRSGITRALLADAIERHGAA